MAKKENQKYWTVEDAEKIFDRKAILIISRNVLPVAFAEKLTSKDAVLFAMKNREPGHWNSYYIAGRECMSYLTKKGFLLACTYENVAIMAKRKDGENIEEC